MGLGVNLGRGPSWRGHFTPSPNPSSHAGVCCSNTSHSPHHGGCTKLLDLAFEALSEKGQLTFPCSDSSPGHTFTHSLLA